MVDFPTSISEDGRRIAAIISIEGELEGYFLEWLAIKDLKQDKLEEEIEIIGIGLSFKLGYDCEQDISACVPELQGRVDAANALLANDPWRPFPCILIYHSGRPERMGPGCELLAELDVDYKDPQLIISRGGRPVVNRSMPTWSPTYRKPKCKGLIDIYVESVAFDPETGLFVIALKFVGIGHTRGECAEPRWDFHPIRLPMFRREAHRARDGGTP
jgi:hypothetical protein